MPPRRATLRLPRSTSSKYAAHFDPPAQLWEAMQTALLRAPIFRGRTPRPRRGRLEHVRGDIAIRCSTNSQDENVVLCGSGTAVFAVPR